MVMVASILCCEVNDCWEQYSMTRAMTPKPIISSIIWDRRGSDVIHWHDEWNGLILYRFYSVFTQGSENCDSYLLLRASNYIYNLKTKIPRVGVIDSMAPNKSRKNQIPYTVQSFTIDITDNLNYHYDSYCCLLEIYLVNSSYLWWRLFKSITQSWH